MRFRKSIKIMPGIKINLSKSGVSASVGRPGATVNVRPGSKTKATIGLPGTGISHTQHLGETKPASESQPNSPDFSGGRAFLLGAIAIFLLLALITR